MTAHRCRALRGAHPMRQSTQEDDMQSEPTLTPMATEIARHAGWTIFETHAEEDRPRYDFMAVNDDTGETRDVDVTGYRRPSDVDLYRLAVLGFPKRIDGAPLTSAQIAGLYEARFQRMAAE